MWIYEKKLQHPICVSCPDVAFAKLVITQYGGPNGELSASLQYLNQRYSMPTNMAKAVLTDIGTEELAHQEMIASLVYKLTCGAGPKEFEKAGWSAKWAQNGPGMFWMDANGVPWIANNVSCVGEPIADLTSNMAAEQRARVTYEHLISQTCDPLVKDMLRFLWQREVVHLQRFGEALNDVEEWMAKCKRVWTGVEQQEETKEQ
ncbi:manganese catalase family protein [Anaerosinus gibii]|uniref:Manganese catalase family protein n=1 Tax=Selenobaculum gibii TaxID=3054208 RepID=A0A9Y2ETV5_9FIRM|nr:manganese catalase family protein [Selenobaculum gbiensis]WIW70550.1 manganese catalase family protein [Selenobaculum gbiensis]